MDISTKTDIIRELRNGKSVRQIAEIYNVNPFCILNIKSKDTDAKLRYGDNPLYLALLINGTERRARTAYNALRRAGIFTLEEIHKISIDDLSNVRFIGAGGLEILIKLKSQI